MEEISQVEKLNGEENFQLWKFEITIILKVNDVTKAPTAERDTNWHKKNANAQKVFVLSLRKKPLTHIKLQNGSKHCAPYMREIVSKKNAY